MSQIKLVITDLDGTFLNAPNEPHVRNVEALRACEKAGIPVRAITARSFTTAYRMLCLGGFLGYCVTSNGASFYDIDSKTRLYHKTIPNDRMELILQECLKARATLFVIAKDFNITCKQLKKHDAKTTDHSTWPEEHRPKHIEVDTIKEMLECIGDDTELVCMHAPDDVKEFSGDFYRSIIEIGEFSLTSSHPGGFDIMASGVCKSSGAQRLAEMMGVQPEEVLACGDHNNDIGMLQWAGIGVAMGDGHVRAREAADYVSLPHDEGGVADAIYRFVL